MTTPPPSTAVADVLQLRGRQGWLSPPLRRVTQAAPIIGPARTVRLVGAEPGSAGLAALRTLLDEDLTGCVLVIAGAAEAEGAVWGEILSLAAHARGAAGVLVDGAVRDVRAMERIGLPVWARTVATAGPGPRVTVAEIGGPVRVGPASVAPDDPVLLDQDGVVALPRADAADLFDAAARYAAAEWEVASALRAGHSLAIAYRAKAEITARLT